MTTNAHLNGVVKQNGHPAGGKDAVPVASVLSNPPKVKRPYDPSRALDDLPGITYALDIFLASHMLESEDYCHKNDPDKQRLYFAAGYGLIQCVKAMMSFEDSDLLAAIGHTKRGNLIAAQHRKPASSVAYRLGAYVTGNTAAHGVAFVKGMTDVQRHAELVYAESLFEKALLGIIYSGDWLAFIKEALNMRTLIGIYKKLGDFLTAADAASPTGYDASIDADFRSGVYLGCGMNNLVLSMMPGKLETLLEVFGYKGDRAVGLGLLEKAGGWVKGKEAPGPGVGVGEEGVRRPICDMALVIFHLFFSSFTFDGIDVLMAQKIIDWNLQRFPNGVFFLLCAGQAALMRSQPRVAVEYYMRAVESQSQYRNLHHLSFWECAIAYLALWDIGRAVGNWRDLMAEATWSKAIYSFGTAVCLYEVGDEKSRKEAAGIFEKVPGLRQRIAGKSIPLEKFVARKAKKFTSQGRLLLPGLELAYIFLAIAHAPREVICGKMMPEVDGALERLKGSEGRYGIGTYGKGYWDDYCLARFLEGVCLRYVAYPDPDAIIEEGSVDVGVEKEAEERAVRAFEFVFENGPKIEWDHHLVYYAHYEYGRLLACMGDIEGGQKQFDLILSDTHLEVGPSGKKGKYSMEGALNVKTHAATDALKKKFPRL